MLKAIPSGSVEIQTGLWAYLRTYAVSGATRSHYELYSAEGYCFYNLEQPENYDDDGNLKPPAERVYIQYASLAICLDTVEKINAHFISVPVQDD